MKFVLIFLIGMTRLSIAFTQSEILTSEERAYLFHIVKKSPILDNNIGRYFTYTGQVIHFQKDQINYDSIETNIINNPELLVIHTSEIRKSPIGIIAEAANKTALWELNKMLLAYRKEDKKSLEIFQSKLSVFMDSLIQHLPQTALKKDKENQYVLKSKIQTLLNSNSNLTDRIKLIETFRFLTDEEKYETLIAINKAINEYVQLRSYQIFTYLGGSTKQYQNVLVAAGDGSDTAGLLEEREKDEKGRWNKGLPKAIGLFPYQLYINSNKKDKNSSNITSRSVTTNNFTTFGNEQITNIHLDVWGYNTEKQTTVVIEKNGKNYPLFGSGETRFLSPDSSFSKGTTYQNIIDSYKAKIAVLEEKIHGKKGFDYWIRYYENRKEKLKTEIVFLEQELANISSFTIHTKGNSKRATAGELNNTYSNKKERGTKQAIYIDKNNQLDEAIRKIKELKKEKEEAIHVQQLLQQKMSLAIDAFGRNWVAYTENNGIYTFADSTQFDLLTQEFTFPPTKDPEDFEVRLIAIPNAVDSPLSDEVMLHINVTSTSPHYNNRIQLAFNDLFDSNSWKINQPLTQTKDSLSLRVFLEQLLDKKEDFTLTLRGNGVGSWNGTRTVFRRSQEEIATYPSEESKNDSIFRQLRASYIDVNINRNIVLEINSYTDNVRTNFEIPNKTIQKLIDKNQATYNQVLSGYRTASILFQLQEELNLFAGISFNREEAKIIIDRLNTAINKSKILVNKTSLKSGLFR